MPQFSESQSLHRSSEYAQAPSSAEFAGPKRASLLLSPRISPVRDRSVSIDNDDALPLKYQQKDQAPNKPTRTSILRAAESGRGSLLPMRSTKLSPKRQSLKLTREVPGRSRSSGPAYPGGLPRTRQDVSSSKLAFLRRRNANASSDDEFDVSTLKIKRSFDEAGTLRRKRSSAASVTSTGSGGTNYTTTREHSGPRLGNGLFCQKQLAMLSRMKLGHLLQVVIVFAVLVLVYESHHKALGALDKLKQFQSEESLLLMHLRKIEQQSVQLHENVQRLATNSKTPGVGDDKTSNQEEKKVDNDLIAEQLKQLKVMEEELGAEVNTLQTRIQLSARNHIIQEFGEGPVQVILDLDFGEQKGAHKISILLWHDTPHGAWTWLEQIGNGLWDGANFQWHQGTIIDALPKETAGGRLQFVETTQHAHQAWTVGLREHGKQHSSLGMYINLQDNSKIHKHETCIGKIIDGFDVLQQLLEATRNQKASSSSVTIRKATAMHYVTKKQTVK